MSTPIIVFYHGFFCIGEPPSLSLPAMEIIAEQMQSLKQCGLEDAASAIYVGLNGGVESAGFTELLPKKSTVIFHGLQSRGENRTIQLIENLVKKLDVEAYICYFHTKGASFPANDPLRTRWRQRMQYHVVTEWRKCVKALDSGVEACGCHYLTPEQYAGLVGHPYFAGNFWFSRASYLKTLSPISEAPAVRQQGIDAVGARYESESWIGHGPRRPRIVDFHPGWPG